MPDKDLNLSLDSERRRAERVDDAVGMHVLPLAPEAMDEAIDNFETRRRRYLARNNFSRISKGFKYALKGLKGREAVLAQYVSSVDEKINLLCELLLAEEGGLSEEATHEVNISVHGIRFQHNPSLIEGSLVELGIRLFPEGQGIFVQGEVVRCEPAEGGQGASPFQVAVSFTLMQEDDRALLASHIQEVSARRSLLMARQELDFSLFES